MLKNYLKTLWRTVQKNKLHTSINIIGLSAAFACSILLFIMVYHEFSYDKFHQNSNRLYKLYTFGNSPQGTDYNSSMPYPAASVVKDDNIGVAKSTRIKQRGREIRYKDKTLEKSISLVDNDFFSMFSFPIINGNKQAPLGSTNNVVLSEKTASALFGKENPIGKSIEVKTSGVWNTLVVSAIVAEAAENSSIGYDVLARTEIDPDYASLKNEWSHTHHDVYVMLDENATQASVEKKLVYLAKKYNTVDESYLKNKGYTLDKNGQYAGLRLLPLTDLHFNALLSHGEAVSKSFLYILLLVAVMIVLIACFNFINLNIGLSFTRTKEIGIRKCLGANKRNVWAQVWGESFAAVFVSMLIGIALAVILLESFNKLMQVNFDASLLYQPVIVLLLLSILFFVSFIASGYPSYIMGKLKTVEILKGKISLKRPGIFRNALIVAQFAIAIVLICSTIVIYLQFQHLRKAPLGYNSNALISVPIKKYEKGKEIVSKMRALLLSQSSVVSVTGTDVNFGLGKDGSTSKTGYGFDYNGRSVETDFMSADYDILKTMDIKVKDGRDFSTNYPSDSTSSVIITESMAKQLTDKNALGLSFYSDSSQPKWNVVGVIEDFHLYSMYEKAMPLTIAMNNNAFLSYVLIKVNTKNPAHTMEQIEIAYKQAEPGVEFSGSFVTENIERWYSNEKRLANLFSAASLVAVLLSCMGLFGLAFIVIRQRVKEIGIRKVLGASAGGITTLVTKEFIKPVIVGLFIAIPIAWWAMNSWLQDFTYRITVHWWVFLIAGSIALLISVLTISFQAIKAAIANPVKSLRTE